MARRAVFALLLCGVLGAVLSDQSDDFDLSDALDLDGKKSTEAPKKPNFGDDFSLEDGVGDGGLVTPKPKPQPNPKPHQPGTSGGFSDSDLLDGTSGGAGGGGGGRGGSGGGGGSGGDGSGGDGGSSRNDEAGQTEPQGLIPGVIGAIVVAVAGAISSFIAYQKKKFCFKENAEQGDINMENHQNIKTEPPVQQTLLAR